MSFEKYTFTVGARFQKNILYILLGLWAGFSIGKYGVFMASKGDLIIIGMAIFFFIWESVVYFHNLYGWIKENKKRLRRRKRNEKFN